MKKTITLKEALLSTDWDSLKEDLYRSFPFQSVYSDIDKVKSLLEEISPERGDVIAIRFVGMTAGYLTSMVRFFKRSTILEYIAMEEKPLLKKMVLPPVHNNDTDYLFHHIETYGKGVDIYRLTPSEVSVLFPYVKKLVPDALEIRYNLPLILGSNIGLDVDDDGFFVIKDVLETLLRSWKPAQYTRREDTFSELYTAISLLQAMSSQMSNEPTL